MTVVVLQLGPKICFMRNVLKDVSGPEDPEDSVCSGILGPGHNYRLGPAG